MGGGPQRPAQWAGSRGRGESLTSDAPHNGGRHPPAGTPFRHPHSEQRRPARAHAVGPVLGPHARTDRSRDTRVAVPRLPAPEGGRRGEGQRLTPDAPHNSGGPPPPGTAPHHPRGTQPPQGMQAKGTVLGPHTHTPAPTACGWRTPTARPVGGQFGEGERLTTDAPHNGGRHCPGNALPPPPQRATLARKGARCGADAGSPHPHRPHLGHTGRGTPAARPRGRAPGGGTAPDTRRPSQRWRATPPGDGPPPSPGRQPPQGMQASGTVLGPQTHRPAPAARGWRTPTARPVGGQLEEGKRLTSDAPQNSGRQPPRGRPSATPTASNAGPQGSTVWGRCWVPHPHRPHLRHTGRGTPAARPRGRAAGGGTAPDTRRPSHRWRATPPGDGPPPSPGQAAPTGHAGQGNSVGPPRPHARARSTRVADPNSPPSRRAVGGGGAPDLRRPSQRWKAPPRERPSATPTASNAGPQGRTLRGRCWVPHPHRPHLGHTGRGTPAARPRGRAAGGGTAPDTRRPSQRWRATPPGDGPPAPPGQAAPTGHAGQGDSVGPPHPQTRARSTWVADPNGPPSGRAFGEGGAPDLRRPSQRWKAPPPGTPFRHPHSEQRRPARAPAVGPVLGPHARTDRTRDTRVAEPRPPAPEGGQPGEGQRLAPDAPHNGGRPPPPGTAPHHPRGTQPPQGIKAKGTVLGPHTHTPAPSARGWRTPTARLVGGR